MAIRTVARRTSLLKRLQLAAIALTTANPFELNCPACRDGGERLEAAIDGLLEATDRVLERHSLAAPSIWDQLPRQDAGIAPARKPHAFSLVVGIAVLSLAILPFVWRMAR